MTKSKMISAVLRTISWNLPPKILAFSFWNPWVIGKAQGGMNPPCAKVLLRKTLVRATRRG